MAKKPTKKQLKLIEELNQIIGSSLAKWPTKKFNALLDTIRTFRLDIGGDCAQFHLSAIPERPLGDDHCCATFDRLREWWGDEDEWVKKELKKRAMKAKALQSRQV